MRRVKSLNRAEKRWSATLLLLCLLPVGVAWLSERRRAAQPRPKPIWVSQKTLAKYKETVPLGGSGYVRLGALGEVEQEEEEGAWDIYVSGPPHPIEAHTFNAQGWKVEFVEELPVWKSSGAKTLGVRVTVPKSARQAIETGGVTAGIFHTRDGKQLFYSDSFGVVSPKPLHSQVQHTNASHKMRMKR